MIFNLTNTLYDGLHLISYISLKYDFIETAYVLKVHNGKLREKTIIKNLGVGYLPDASPCGE